MPWGGDRLGQGPSSPLSIAWVTRAAGHDARGPSQRREVSRKHGPGLRGEPLEAGVFDWTSATVLVTGGTGSFGRQFAEIMLRDYHPAKLIIYSRDEQKQHLMLTQGLDHPDIRYFIGDVRDVERLRRAFQDVNVVVHAAALKQVPACEYNPIEAVATNINGARNVIDAALDNRVERVLALSTDKAAAPVNIYGATKLVAEKLFVHANQYNRRGRPGTAFSCVRYGNVLGSRGSVVPLLAEQRVNGRVRITDPRMTRFWLTLDQAVHFVIACIERMRGGEVFIPKLPSMKTLDLARTVAPEAEIEYIGIRPGEKLHESLITREEARATIDAGDCYIMLPGRRSKSRQDGWHQGEPVPEDFCYSSDSNPNWLTSEEIQELIDAKQMCGVES